MIEDIRFLKQKKIYFQWDDREGENIYSINTDPTLQIKINGEWVNVRMENEIIFDSKCAKELYEKKKGKI